MSVTTPTSQTWREILAAAYALFDDLEQRGFPPPPFSLGGGTVLMFRFEHRLSKDIDFFGYDAQWLSLLSPRLNEMAARIAASYIEQANSVKISLPIGDIDFVVAGDVSVPVVRQAMRLDGRDLLVDPTDEIIAKKLFYRPATLLARDAYDLSAAIELDPSSARRAVQAAAAKAPILIRRLDELAKLDSEALVRDIVPYDGRLPYADEMVGKVRAFVVGELGGGSA